MQPGCGQRCNLVLGRAVDLRMACQQARGREQGAKLLYVPHSGRDADLGQSSLTIAALDDGCYFGGPWALT